MYGFEAQASKPSSNGFDTQSTPSRLSLVLTNKPVNPHACLVRCERDSSMSTCVRPPPRLMPLRSFLTWLTSSLAPHVGACLASTKCHDAIVLLLDLVDAVSITHVLLLFMCPVPSQPYLVYPSSWPLSPSLLTRPFTAPGPSRMDFSLDFLHRCRHDIPASSQRTWPYGEQISRIIESWPKS
jgi:hypothetical protein